MDRQLFNIVIGVAGALGGRLRLQSVWVGITSAHTVVGGGILQFAITADGSSFTYKELVVPAGGNILFPSQGGSFLYGQAGIPTYASSTTIGGVFYLAFKNVLITSTDADTFTIAYNFTPLFPTVQAQLFSIGIDQSGNVRVLEYYYNGSSSSFIRTYTGNTSAPDTFVVRNISEAGRPYYMMKVA